MPYPNETLSVKNSSKRCVLPFPLPAVLYSADDEPNIDVTGSDADLVRKYKGHRL